MINRDGKCSGFEPPKANEYSVNVADILRDPVLGPFVIGPVTPSQIVRAIGKDRFDEIGVVLECDEERAKAIIAIIRMRYRKHELRCYKGSKRV